MKKLEYPHTIVAINTAEYIFMFLVLLFLGAATEITKGSLESFSLAVGGDAILVISAKFAMFVYALYLLKKHGHTVFVIPKALMYCWLGGLQIMKYHCFSSYPIVRIMNFFFAFAILRISGTKLIYVVEYIIVTLSTISLVGWCLTLIMPDVVIALSELSPIKSDGLAKGESFVFYAVADSFEFARRNLGFAWEPA